MSDVPVMTAIIAQYAQRNGLPCDMGSARRSAQALYDAGFRMAADDTDADQNSRLRTAEDRLARLEGWAGIPPWYETPKGG